MLILGLKPGEYIVVGENVIVQYTRVTAGNRARILVDAPRDLTVLRGEVWERAGNKRPDCVIDTTPTFTKELRWDSSKSQALAAMRRLLANMDDNRDVQKLRQQLDQMFPRDP